MSNYHCNNRKENILTQDYILKSNFLPCLLLTYDLNEVFKLFPSPIFKIINIKGLSRHNHSSLSQLMVTKYFLFG